MSLPSPSQRPTVSIVTVNYNGLAHLADCFDSLRRLDYPTDRFEVVCVDNASADASLDFIRAHYPEVRIIEAGGNLGFAAGCNLGARQSQSDLVAFLNNDARVDPGWLEALVACVETDVDTACAAAKMLDWEGQSVDFVEGHVNFHGFARQAHWRDPYQAGDFSASRPLLFACGGAMLVRRALFLEIGGFDERFWMFFEDVDFGWRLWVLGYRVAFAPDALTYHRHHGSAGKLSTYRRNFLYERNGLMMLLKNYEDETLLRALPASMAMMVHRASDYLQRAAGGFDLLDPDAWHALDVEALDRRISLGDLAPLVAMRAVMEALPEVMRERRRIQSARRRPDAEILPLFGQPRRLYPMGHLLVQDYCESQQSLWQALGLDRIFAAVPTRVALLATAGPPGLGFPESRQGRRAEAIGRALEAAGHVVVWCLPERLIARHRDLALDARARRCAWNDRTIDHRLMHLGPDVIVATHWRALAFARLSIYRPVVLDHDASDPLPDFELEIAEHFDSLRERNNVRRMLLRKDYLANVDLYTAASPEALAACRRFLADSAGLEPPDERFHLVTDADLAAPESPAASGPDSLGRKAASAAPPGPIGQLPGRLPAGAAGLDAFCRSGVYQDGRLPVEFRPPFPRTPAWELPLKAWRSLRRDGASRLAGELRQYGRWIWHGIQRRLAR
ncbi:MAG: glycosyltransferase family 2 protein [Chloroflexi bacterium]|nr:glycosyltransferase family 2 protein [Chloroflexota bacterium]